MRVRVAYISSLGTTAILVAAAFTLLTVVGTIVAFKGWPGSADSSGVQSVPLAPGGTPARAALVRRVPAAQHVVRKAPAHASARHASTAGLVKTAGTGKQIVPGLIMVPVHAAPPMAAHPIAPPHAAVPGAGTRWRPVRRATCRRQKVPGRVPATGGGLTPPLLEPGVPRRRTRSAPSPAGCCPAGRRRRCTCTCAELLSGQRPLHEPQRLVLHLHVVLQRAVVAARDHQQPLRLRGRRV